MHKILYLAINCIHKENFYKVGTFLRMIIPKLLKLISNSLLKFCKKKKRLTPNWKEINLNYLVMCSSATGLKLINLTHLNH